MSPHEERKNCSTIQKKFSKSLLNMIDSNRHPLIPGILSNHV